MRWSNLTGLEPETKEDHRRIRRQMRRFYDGFGRITVVALLAFSLLFAVPEETFAELAMQAGPVFGHSVVFSAIDPLLFVAIVWALSPMAYGLYGLWQLVSEARTTDDEDVNLGELFG